MEVVEALPFAQFGSDTIRHLTGQAEIDLRQEAFSSFNGVVNLPIVYGSVIEAAESDGANDRLTGDVAKVLRGNGGNDTLLGGAGNDTLGGGIVDACCDAWNRLTADTGRIKSIATRNWVATGQ